MRKVQKDTKILLFENMAKLNPDFKLNEGLGNFHASFAERTGQMFRDSNDAWTNGAFHIRYKMLVKLGVEDALAQRYADEYENKSWDEVKNIIGQSGMNEEFQDFESPEEYRVKAEKIKTVIDSLVKNQEYDVLDTLYRLMVDRKSRQGTPIVAENMVDEISTGLAQKASDTATNKYFSSDDEPITARKRDLQSHRFNQYVNPELKKFIMGQFGDVPNLSIGREGTALMLKFPINNPQESPQVDNVTVHIRPDNYDITKGIVDQFGRINNEKGGSHLLSQRVLSVLPNIIKRIQVDMRGEKSKFNPIKPVPAPQPEPVPVTQPEPVQQTIKPTGMLDKLRSKFGRNE